MQDFSSAWLCVWPLTTASTKRVKLNYSALLSADISAINHPCSAKHCSHPLENERRCLGYAVRRASSALNFDRTAYYRLRTYNRNDVSAAKCPSAHLSASIVLNLVHILEARPNPLPVACCSTNELHQQKPWCPVCLAFCAVRILFAKPCRLQSQLCANGKRNYRGWEFICIQTILVLPISWFYQSYNNLICFKRLGLLQPPEGLSLLCCWYQLLPSTTCANKRTILPPPRGHSNHSGIDIHFDTCACAHSWILKETKCWRC